MISSFGLRFFTVFFVLIASASAARADAYSDFWDSIRRDNSRSLAALLAKGMDPNTVGANGDPALVTALREQAKDATRILLEAPGLKPDQAGVGGETALMVAAIQGNEGVARQLIERGAQVNRAGWAPLHYAASAGHVGIVDLLLAHGAKVDAQTAGGVTPLMMAARDNQTRVVDRLLEVKAKRDLCSDRGLSAADFARHAGHGKLAQRLSIANCA